MALCTKGSGSMAKPMVLDVSFTPMEISMKESGATTKQVGRVSIFTTMVRCMKVSGRMINNMATALKHGKTKLNISVPLSTGSSMDMVNSSGLKEPAMSVSSKTMTSAELVNIRGPMDESTSENGKRTKCMEREFSSGLTVVYTKVNMLMIASRGKVRSNGPTDASIAVRGIRIGRMDLDNLPLRKA